MGARASSTAPGSWPVVVLVDEAEGPVPTFFLLPTERGGTRRHLACHRHVRHRQLGLQDRRRLRTREDYVHCPFQQFLDASSGITERFPSPLYSTPLMAVLGITAALPILGAAQNVLAEFTGQMRN